MERHFFNQNSLEIAARRNDLKGRTAIFAKKLSSVFAAAKGFAMSEKEESYIYTVMTAHQLAEDSDSIDMIEWAYDITSKSIYWE